MEKLNPQVRRPLFSVKINVSLWRNDNLVINMRTVKIPPGCLCTLGKIGYLPAGRTLICTQVTCGTLDVCAKVDFLFPKLQSQALRYKMIRFFLSNEITLHLCRLN